MTSDDVMEDSRIISQQQHAANLTYPYSGSERLPETGITVPSLANVTNLSNAFVYEARADFLPDDLYEPITRCLTTVVSPVLCLFGFTGNILNILVLTRRRMQTSIDNKMERTACMGLTALAVSDLLYCLCAFPRAFNKEQLIYTEGYFWMYYTALNNYFRNVFSYWSTWLTVNLAVGRYIAICHPLHARMFVNPGANKLVILVTLLAWAALVLPEAFTFAISPPGPNETGYLLDLGIYSTNRTLQRAFSYVCTILGFVIPVSLLAFCNIQLIRALRASYRMRKEYRVHGKNPQSTSRITPTLITIVMMFIILVSPSEVLNIVMFATEKDNLHHTQFAIEVTNILHTINFSINFVLYCVVNVHFRETLRDLFCCCLKRNRTRLERGFTASYSNVTTKSYVGGPVSNNETAL